MPQPPRRHRILRMISICLGLYVLAGIAMMLLQRSMIYHPSRAPGRILLEAAKGEGFEPWENASGQRIGWKRVHAAIAASPATVASTSINGS